MKVTKTLAEKERERLKNASDEKATFIGRNVTLYYFLLFGLYPIAAIYSAFTGGSALLVYIQSITNYFPAALGITISAVVILEAAKFFFGSAVAEDVRHHVWTETRHHITAFILKACAFAGIFGASIYLSLSGAPDVAEGYREARLPVTAELIDLEAIKAEYNTKIEAERADIARAERMTWKGKIIADGRAIIRQAKDNITAHEKALREALEAAQAENTAIRAEYDQDTRTVGNWLLGFAGGGEVLALLILFFLANYRAGAIREVSTDNSENKASTAAVNITPNAGQVFSENTAQRPRIGFKIPNASTNASTTNASANATVREQSVNTCQHCDKEYVPKVSWQKFCSADCRLDHHAEKNNGKRFNPKKYHSAK